MTTAEAIAIKKAFEDCEFDSSGSCHGCIALRADIWCDALYKQATGKLLEATP